jgi:hypothetical protein
MRNVIFWAAIAAGALMQVGVAAWASSHERALEGQAYTQIESVHPFQMMLNAKKLPNGSLRTSLWCFLRQRLGRHSIFHFEHVI